ncbi:phage portal protein [Gluconobacter cerinus]|uniref:phage portal protein n=1 Tax=Gluconobacter cerinus TaxID=38307 RepID=UPI001B8C87ED|nr:phage portal protein [Gluconobacter cerinus]MBS1035384.1 phage portal protein [Gluconobacter cerinus]
MGFWSRLIGLEQRSPKTGPAALFHEYFSGMPAKSGVAVSWESSLNVTTVLACARVIAEDVAGMPRGVYRRQAAERHPLPTDPLQMLLDFPNDWQTGEELVEQLTLHAVLTGDGIAIKNMVRGEVRELLPVLPQWVTKQQSGNWIVGYKITLPDGGPPILYDRSAILHIRGPSWDGFQGLDIVRKAREAIGLAVALEESHAKLHRNGVQASGVYSVDGSLDEPQYKRLKAAIEQQIAGNDQHSAIILDRGGKYTSNTMSGVDSEHVATRKLQIEEICRAMRVFPQMVGHSDKASTFASAEQFFLAHVKYTLLPWVRRWETGIRRDLITKNRPDIYVKHNVASLERADIKTRYEAYQLAINAGWMLRSDARELEDMLPVAGINRPTLPLNTGVLDGNGLPVPASEAPHSVPPGDPDAPSS